MILYDLWFIQRHGHKQDNMSQFMAIPLTAHAIDPDTPRPYIRGRDRWLEFELMEFFIGRVFPRCGRIDYAEKIIKNASRVVAVARAAAHVLNARH